MSDGECSDGALAFGWHGFYGVVVLVVHSTVQVSCTTI